MAKSAITINPFMFEDIMKNIKRFQDAMTADTVDAEKVIQMRAMADYLSSISFRCSAYADEKEDELRAKFLAKLKQAEPAVVNVTVSATPRVEQPVRRRKQRSDAGKKRRRGGT